MSLGKENISDIMNELSGCSMEDVKFKRVECGIPVNTKETYLIIPEGMNLDDLEVKKAIKEIEKQHGKACKIIIIGDEHIYRQALVTALTDSVTKFGCTAEEASKNIKALSKSIDELKIIEKVDKPSHPFEKFIGKKKY